MSTRTIGILALLLGGLILAVAIGQSYAAWRFHKSVGRLEMIRMADQLVAPMIAEAGPVQGGNQAVGSQQAQGSGSVELGSEWQWVGVSVTTRYVWLGMSWACAFLLGLSGLWCMLRRRLAWRLIFVAAIATIVAGVFTVTAGYVMVHWAGYPPLSKRIYAVAFWAHSAPGWVLLVLWTAARRRRADTTDLMGAG